MVYRALVADDELMIRRGIISFLNKYEDFEVVAEAEDGEIALEMAMGQEIDVYFVDITMPFLNGLEFIRELKNIQPDALVVIITGYDLFEYAREGISLGIFDYLLKPIQEEVFDDLIKRARVVLAENSTEMLAKRYLGWAKEKLVENREHLISDFLNKILDGHLTVDEIEQECDYLHLEIPYTYYLILIKLDYQKNDDMKQVWNEDLLFFAAQNVAKEVFATLSCETSCQDDYGNLVLLVEREESPNKEASLKIEEKIKQYQQFLASCMPVKCSVVWEGANGVGELGKVYHEAVQNIKRLRGFSEVISSILQIAEENYQREDLSLQDVADEVNLSIPYLSKLFRKELGYTFVDYLTDLRIRKAIELLHDDSMKMYEIAESVGYASQHYFSNVFKKKLGISPIDYKRNIKEEAHGKRSNFTNL